MTAQHPDIVILGYPALQRDHEQILHAAHNHDMHIEVWAPETLHAVITETHVAVHRNGKAVQPGIVLPRGVNRVWPFVEQVLTLWQHTGTTIVNSISAATTCADKLATLTRLAHAGIPVMPATGVTPGPGINVTRMPAPLVVKPAYGSGGADVQLFTTAHDTQHELDSRPLPSGAWRVEHAIVGPVATGAGRDYRVVVVGGEVAACTERTAPPGTFVTNGTSAAVRPTSIPDIEQVAVDAAAALGMDFAGVDIIRNGPDQRPVVLEVNAWPGLAMTSTVCGVDLGQALLQQALKVHATRTTR